jgi:hypothetical protein
MMTIPLKNDSGKGRRLPGAATGEMYKRDTFGSRPFTPESCGVWVKML